MDSSQEVSGNDKDDLAQEVADGLGTNEVEEPNESQEASQGQPSGDPLYVQKRLKQQKRAHDREIREMQARMAEMQAQLAPQGNPQSFDANPNIAPGGYQQPGNMDETIQRAVSVALQHRDMEERKAKDREAAAHIAKQYQDLQKHLDKTSDKYDDFDELVRGDAPFTAHMRDAALMLPKQGSGAAGEVLYHLGKNPEELKRISQLPPVDQASEMVKLSHALISGGDNKKVSPRIVGQIKANPVSNSVGVTDKTPPSEIRALMKAGKFK